MYEPEVRRHVVHKRIQRHFIEHENFLYTNILILSFTGACDPAFLLCFVWSSTDSLDLQMHSSGTLLDTGGGTK